MLLNPIDNPICLEKPEYLSGPSAWVEHIPFAFAIVSLLQPKIFVELGTHYGDSYLAFCQAVKKLGLDTQCFAIDTWQGDEHAGFYGEEVFAQVQQNHDVAYGDFSRLIRSTFDQAANQFDANSIDLLHIDGLHSYEAVKHDFEVWLPKMSSRGVILFHDTNVFDRGFGVWRLWRELEAKYPHFEFSHGHGLGVLVVGQEAIEPTKGLHSVDNSTKQTINDFFCRLGQWVSRGVHINKLTKTVGEYVVQLENLHLTLTERGLQIDNLNAIIIERDDQISILSQIANERATQIDNLSRIATDRLNQTDAINRIVHERDDQIMHLNRVIGEYRNSTSWYVTKPLRLVGGGLKMLFGSKWQFSSLFSRKSAFHPPLLQEDIRRKLVKYSHAFYRRWLKGSRIGRLIAHQIIQRGYISSAEIYISALTQTTEKKSPVEETVTFFVDTDLDVPGFHLSQPINLIVSAPLTIRAHINVLIPSLRLRHMSGGPNTALLFAAHLAERGELVRLIAVDSSPEGEEQDLYPHIEGLFQRPVRRERITLIDGFDRTKPILIGANDLFLATAWWTAQIAKYAIKKTNFDKFIYLIQDFEPILHDASTFQARATETYALPHIPIINTRLLLDHLVSEGCGCYAQPEFVSDALHFEPAIDRAHYFPVNEASEGKERKRRVLLFYARPTVARRNLFEIGIAALRRLVASGAINNDAWEVWSMGEKLDAIHLGNDVYLNPLPWMSFEAYAERVRTADLLLSLMLSPHPSYPPLEMAASGKLVVTNSCSVKTAERMGALSRNILVAQPTPDSIASALENAVGRINVGLPSPDPSGVISFPTSWEESLQAILPALMERINNVRQVSSAPRDKRVGTGYPITPISSYEYFRKRRLTTRRNNGSYAQIPGLLSFVTAAFNTDPIYLEELAGSIFLQDGGTNFEWLILDNGSSVESTRSTLRAIAQHPCVRLERVEENLGIIGGMRYCLERSTGRYILPLDSDDIVEPDCVNVLTHYLVEANFPPLLYTDEDKLAKDQFIAPYFKPDWDPVLFVNSCYIAHLCAIDRNKAIELGLYTDRAAEGCHDWNSFIRFMNAGHEPLHVPEVLYSWRIHEQSTSGNIASKSYISDSHQSTLRQFLDKAQAPDIELVESPLFNYHVDRWFRRKRCNPLSSISIIITTELQPSKTANHNRHALSLAAAKGITGLADLLNSINTELVHISWDGVSPDSDEWFWDSMGNMELFKDTVMVGGTLHNGVEVLDGPKIFGFGEGFDCPDRGRSLSDPGYFCQMWKHHSVSAVSSGHCVVRYNFLKEVIGELLQEAIPLSLLGPWLGGLAQEAKRRVVFSPFMSAKVNSSPESRVNSENRAQFLSRFWRLIPDTRFYSRRLSLSPPIAYSESEDDEIGQHVLQLQHSTPHYNRWLEMEIQTRGRRYPIPEKPVTFSVLTAVYEKSNFALLDVLAESILTQSLPLTQWVIVANGPISERDLERLQGKSKTTWGSTLIIERESLGIVGALRRALEHARGEYIFVVDGDDVITPDAAQILAHTIAQRGLPDLVFSDEDQLIDGVPSNPYLRSAFDPILNIDSSYIWHLCAIKRTTALELNLYDDAAANWCQDWDSVMRIFNAGGRIEHIPEVLYHWRQHSGSTTNNPGGDSRSLESVRHILQRQISHNTHPENFSVETFPINRGTKELFIARKNSDLPTFIWIGDLIDTKTLCSIDENSVLVVARNGVSIKDDGAFNEVARLFELHSDLAAIGGRVLNTTDTVIDGCLVKNQSGDIESPWVGSNACDGGPYALALKPQSVFTTGADLAFFRVKAMQALGCSLPIDISSLPIWVHAMCEQLGEAGWRIAYSPLITARAPNALSNRDRKRHRFHKNNLANNFILARYGKLCSYDIH